MLLISSEKSKCEQTTKFFKEPIWWILKGLPERIHDVVYPTDKIIFNHDKFNGIEEPMCIGGLQDLDSKVTLLTGKRVTVRELLKSFPPSPGMSHPVFYQEVENNSSGQVVIVSYQKTDAPLVKKR